MELGVSIPHSQEPATCPYPFQYVPHGSAISSSLFDIPDNILRKVNIIKYRLKQFSQPAVNNCIMMTLALFDI
jgi:hypothetical protein